MQSNQRRDFGENLKANEKFAYSKTMPKQCEPHIPPMPIYKDKTNMPPSKK